MVDRLVWFLTISLPKPFPRFSDEEIFKKITYKVAQRIVEKAENLCRGKFIKKLRLVSRSKIKLSIVTQLHHWYSDCPILSRHIR